MDANELAIKLQKGDQMALKYLYDHYAQALLGIIYRIIDCRDTSEEILQETFVKIWSNMDKYDSTKSRLFTWMSRIARNTAIDKRRSKNFENNRSNISLDPSIHNSGVNGIDTSSMDIKRLTKDLDPKYSQVLEYVYLKGYSHADAAEALGIPKGTVKTRLRSSLKQLREVLKNEKALFIGAASIMGLIILLALCN